MQVESHTAEEFLSKLISFIGTKALYHGELPTAAIGRFLIQMEDTILPKSTLNALTEVSLIENKLKESKGINADEVFNSFKELSKSSVEMANSFVEAEKVMKEDSQVFQSVKNSLVNEKKMNKIETGLESVLQQFGVNPEMKPLVADQQQQAGKDQNMKM